MSLSRIVNPAAGLRTLPDGVGAYTQPVVDQKGVQLFRMVDASGNPVTSNSIQEVINTTTGKTQANGVFTVSPYAAGRVPPYSTTVAIECSATPTAGTLLVEYRCPGMTTWKNFMTISLATPTDPTINGYAYEFRFTPTGFDADKSYSVSIIGKG